MSCAAGIPLALIAAALLAGLPVNAQTAPGATGPSKPASSWNSSTVQREKPPENTDDSTLSLRVYEGVNSRPLLPYRPGPPEGPAYAVDVSAVMSRCADGRLLITALVIGGQLTPLDNRCSDGPQKEPGPAAPCDADRWQCATAPPR